MKEFVCIVCPKGCRLRVDVGQGLVAGNSCERGRAYGLEEAAHPTRIITSTVCVANGGLRRCPVKLDRAIPKALVLKAVKALDGICLRAPVKQGAVVLARVCGTDASFITTRDIDTN